MIEVKETEREFVTRVCDYLKKWMHIELELDSDCKKGRIDVVAECKLTSTRFGIECKRHDKKRGEAIGEFIRQGMRYSKMTFNGSPIPIFIAPPLSNEYLALVQERKIIDGKEYIVDRHEPKHEHHTVNGILGDFNVGELRRIKHDNHPYMSFIFSNRSIYSLKPRWNNEKRKYDLTDIEGLHKENYSRLMMAIKEWRL